MLEEFSNFFANGFRVSVVCTSSHTLLSHKQQASSRLLCRLPNKQRRCSNCSHGVLCDVVWDVHGTWRTNEDISMQGAWTRVPSYSVQLPQSLCRKSQKVHPIGWIYQDCSAERARKGCRGGSPVTAAHQWHASSDRFVPTKSSVERRRC